MNNSNPHLDDIREAKKFSLSFKTQAIQGLILVRYRSLTIISSICFALVGVFIALSFGGQLIENTILAYLSFGLLILLALISLGRYLYLIRDDIDDISKQIKNLPNEDWSKPLNIDKPKQDYWPEALFIFLIISIILFVLSLVDLEILCS